jgi:hypothetical protein
MDNKIIINFTKINNNTLCIIILWMYNLKIIIFSINSKKNINTSF